MERATFVQSLITAIEETKKKAHSSGDASTLSKVAYDKLQFDYPVSTCMFSVRLPQITHCHNFTIQSWSPRTSYKLFSQYIQHHLVVIL